MPIFSYLFSNLQGQHLCFLKLGHADCKVVLFASHNLLKLFVRQGGSTHPSLSLPPEDLAWLSTGHWVGGP